MSLIKDCIRTNYKKSILNLFFSIHDPQKKSHKLLFTGLPEEQTSIPIFKRIHILLTQRVLKYTTKVIDIEQTQTQISLGDNP